MLNAFPVIDPMENLAALDLEDLNIMSAHSQDALLRFGDIRYLRRSHIFAFVANRFVWEEAKPKRRRTGFHIRNVLNVQQLGITKPHNDMILSLLAMSFEITDEPAGVITLHFSAGFAIRLQVEYLQVQMKDLGPEWPTDKFPHHKI